ncbi:MAG: radical SAM protein, partial [Nitrospinota bacterium]
MENTFSTAQIGGSFKAMFQVKKMELKEIEEKVLAGERLDFEDGIQLYNSSDLIAVGRLANIVRENKNGKLAYFIQNLHINPTNYCQNECHFCAFAKKPGDSAGYAMTVEDVVQKAESIGNRKISEFHIVGGLNPDFPFQYYLDILFRLKERFPKVHIQAFTAVEIAYFSEISKLSVVDVLKTAAGKQDLTEAE